jgi:hypothetical protein
MLVMHYSYGEVIGGVKTRGIVDEAHMCDCFLLSILLRILHCKNILATSIFFSRALKCAMAITVTSNPCKPTTYHQRTNPHARTTQMQHSSTSQFSSNSLFERTTRVASLNSVHPIPNIMLIKANLDPVLSLLSHQRPSRTQCLSP